MSTVVIALGSLVLYLVAYHTYGRWLSRRLFALDPEARTPAVALRDDIDYVPSHKDVVFGHHYTSIAGTGPIVGPAVAIIWGWVPALIWVLLGSVLMGAVHDFGALVMSLRHEGKSIGDIAGVVVGKRARVLFLSVVFLALLIVVAIFALVIASVFALYPHSVIPVWLEIPIAVVLGLYIAKATGSRQVLIASIVAVVIMYVTVAIGSIAPLQIPAMAGMPPTFWWAIVLLVYAFVASVLPVQTLLQPRDFINSHQLLIAMALLVLGVVVSRPAIVAPAVQMDFAGASKFPFFPFLFVTVACGAISGFHGLVGSGTTSKQLSCESDARLVGYGSMLTEGFLAVLVIIAVSAGLGLDYKLKFGYARKKLVIIEDAAKRGRIEALAAALVAPPVRQGSASQQDTAALAGFAKELKAQSKIVKQAGGWANLRRSGRLAKLSGALKELSDFRTSWPSAKSPSDGPVIRTSTDVTKGVSYSTRMSGVNAWRWHYRSWGAAEGLGPKLKAFVDGSANMISRCGIGYTLALAVMGVFVASFAGTTLDTATRLQRYIVTEFGRTTGIGVLENRYVATAFAVVTAGILALWDGAGAGALVLWPLFGALNQLLAALGLLVLTIYLYRKAKPIWMTAAPLVFMLVMTFWAMVLNLRTYRADGRQHLAIITAVVLALELWMLVEAAVVWRGLRRERQAGEVGTHADSA